MCLNSASKSKLIHVIFREWQRGIRRSKEDPKIDGNLERRLTKKGRKEEMASMEDDRRDQLWAVHEECYVKTEWSWKEKEERREKRRKKRRKDR